MAADWNRMNEYDKLKRLLLNPCLKPEEREWAENMLLEPHMVQAEHELAIRLQDVMVAERARDEALAAAAVDLAAFKAHQVEAKAQAVAEYQRRIRAAHAAVRTAKARQ